MSERHDDDNPELERPGVTVPMTPPSSGFSAGPEAAPTSRSASPGPDAPTSKTPSPKTDQDAATVIQDPLMGRTLDGRYHIRMVLGQGGMGKVYLAEDTKLNRRKVAIKLMTVPGGLDAEFRARFRREALLQANLPHAQIIQVLDVGDSDEGSYIVMEYSEGRSLSSMIRELGPIATDRAMDIIEQVLEVLDFAHRQGIVHRDLKPSNILIEDRAGRSNVRILDFGIAKLLKPDEEKSLQEHHTLTRVGFVVGTPGYMAPEQAAGETDKLDHRADLYATGVVLYEMLTGKVPCPRDQRSDPVRYALWVCQNEIPRLRKSHPDLDIPPDLDEILGRALATEPDDRFSSAYTFLADLRGHRGIEMAARTPPSTRTGVRRTTRAPARWRPFVVCGLWLVSLGAVGWLWFSESQDVRALRGELDELRAAAKTGVSAEDLASKTREIEGLRQDKSRAERERDDARKDAERFLGEKEQARLDLAAAREKVRGAEAARDRLNEELETARKAARELRNSAGADASSVAQMKRDVERLKRDLGIEEERARKLRSELQTAQQKVFAVQRIFGTSEPAQLESTQRTQADRLRQLSQDAATAQADFARANQTAEEIERQHRAVIARNAFLERRNTPAVAGSRRLTIHNEVRDRNIRIIIESVHAIRRGGGEQQLSVRKVPIYHRGTPYEVRNLPGDTESVRIRFRQLHRFKANRRPETRTDKLTGTDTKIVIR